ncbi:hypothetical protein TNCV_2360731 [Trichonephila clavipes]|nr:hypothetical protein TNCV_2360731 [Trichonephila clavipes]
MVIRFKTDLRFVAEHYSHFRLQAALLIGYGTILDHSVVDVGLRIKASKTADTFQRLKKCLTAGFELITSNCHSLKEAGWANRIIVFVMWVEAIRPLGEAGKNEWTMVDLSVMMVAVD